MEIQGQVTYINEVKTPSAAKPDFKVLEFGIMNRIEQNFQPVEKVFGFQTSRPDVMEKVQQLNVGDTIEVSFGIRGSKKEKPELAPLPKNPTNLNYFTSLDAFSVKFVTGTGVAPAPAHNPATATAAQTQQATPPIGSDGKPMVWDASLGKYVDAPPF